MRAKFLTNAGPTYFASIREIIYSTSLARDQDYSNQLHEMIMTIKVLHEETRDNTSRENTTSSEPQSAW